MKTLDKRKKFLLGGAVGTMALAAVLLIILPPVRKGDGSEEKSIVGVIPEADLDEGEQSKTGSYRKGASISDYWDALGETSSPPEPEFLQRFAEDSAAADVPQESRRPQSMAVEDLFGDYRAEEPAPRPSRKRSVPVADPQPGTTIGPDTDDSPPGPEPVRIQVKRSGSISSLDEDVHTDLGSGFSTLDGTDRWVDGEPGRPYRCMFTRDEKVKGGQRITVRLLEDLVIGGVHIPQNTHLQGVVTISDRMEVSVTSLDMGGRILSFHFEAFDTDGGKGIYCSDLEKTRREAAEQGLATAGTLLNSRLGRVARDAASVGASIVRNKAGEATVKVPAGYTFYLIQQER